jgi:peptide/nickel transport system substrate-binding protein
MRRTEDAPERGDHAAALRRRDALRGFGASTAALAILAGSAPAALAQYGQPGAGGKEFHGAWPYQVPPVGHYNQYGVNPIGLGIYRDLIEQPLAMYFWQDDRWLNLLGTSWEIVPPDRFNVHLRPGVKWSDGSNLTAKDLIDTWTLHRLMAHVAWRFTDRIEQLDDSTVSFVMSNPTTTYPRYILKEPVRPSAIYGSYADQVRGLLNRGLGADSNEWKTLRQQFGDFKPDKWLASGPYVLDPASMTEAQLTLNKVPSAWNAGSVLFDKIVLYNGETPVVTPVVLSKNVDYATHGFPPATEKAFQEQGLRILRPPVFNGPAIIVNFADPALAPLGDKKVRQAMMYAIDRAQNGQVALGPSGVPIKTVSGFSDNLVPLWLAPTDLDRLNPYPYDVNKATGMMNDLGFTKGADGVWVAPGGQRLEYEILFQAEYADWSAAAQNAAEQLTKFGIKVTPRSVTFTQFDTEVFNGRFQLASGTWGAAHPHPHFSFVQDLLYYHDRDDGGQALGPGQSFSLQQDTDVLGHVDLNQMITDAANGLDLDAQKRVVSDLSAAVNELLPMLPLWERYGNNPVLENVRVTGWPPDGDSVYKQSPYSDSFVVMMMLQGRLKPAG